MKKIFIIGFFVFFLPGCSPVFMAGSVTSTVINGDNRKASAIYDDGVIDAKLLSTFTSDKKFKNSSISSTTYNHKVLLVGATTSASAKSYAKNIALATPDVEHVYNYIRVKSPLPSSTYSEDTIITTKVRTALLKQKGLKSASIKVVTDNGTVYLFGIVLPSQSSLAVSTVRKVDGVKGVVNLFEYLT